jgi:hypothetical protein
MPSPSVRLGGKLFYSTAPPRPGARLSQPQHLNSPVRIQKKPTLSGLAKLLRVVTPALRQPILRSRLDDHLRVRSRDLPRQNCGR